MPGGASAGGTRLGGGGQNNIMMDGISAMDTGNNGQMLNLNIESIAEVKVLTQGYQAEYGRSSGLQITAVTKSGTNRFRGSVYDVKSNSDWNDEQLGQRRRTATRSRSTRKTLGLHDRRSGRQAGRQEQAVLLLQPRVPPDQRGDQQRQPDPVSRADRARARRATSRRRSTTTAALFNLITDASPARLHGDRHRGCFQDGGVLGRIPANRLYQHRPRDPDRYPLPNMHAGAGIELQLRE